MSTFGKVLWDSLKADAQRLGRKCTEQEFVAKADALFADVKRARRNTPKGEPRARNPLWDALALATGQRSLTEISRPAAKLIGVALADIKEATPDVTVEEIYRRAAAYKARNPTWTLSAPALVKHWGEFSQGTAEERTRAAKSDVYLEPPNWFPVAVELYGADVAEMFRQKGWFNFGLDYRRAILVKLNAAA
jgi:hypothetical protein